MNRLHIFAVGIVFGWLVEALLMTAQPGGGGFVANLARFDHLLGAFVLTLGGALAYRAAMARIEHDKGDVEFRRTVLAESLNREFEARIHMLAYRIAFMGFNIRERETLGRDDFKWIRVQLSPARKRLASWTTRLWAELDEVATDKIPSLTNRGIRSEALLRNIRHILQVCDAQLRAFDEDGDRPAQSNTAILEHFAFSLEVTSSIDEVIEQLIKSTIEEARIDRGKSEGDISIFDG